MLYAVRKKKVKCPGVALSMKASYHLVQYKRVEY